MKKILISACLVGDKTRYDGKGCYHPLVKKLLEKYELIPFCPEVEGGLKIPRVPSERFSEDKVKNKNHVDVTKYFVDGAEKALTVCRYLNIKTAILKDESPSCGVYKIYNGLFQERLIPGMGVTTQLLKKNGIEVISENDIEKFLKDHENKFEK